MSADKSLTRTVDVELRPTPEELARVLSHMDATEQALFFNALGRAEREWGAIYGSVGWPMQLRYLADSDALSVEGRRIMNLIGEYANE